MKPLKKIKIPVNVAIQKITKRRADRTDYKWKKFIIQIGKFPHYATGKLEKQIESTQRIKLKYINSANNITIVTLFL